tara:strand:- start:1041 stop:1361 length:321 start_codon:yes stop_codon:yes gene_type:complete
MKTFSTILAVAAIAIAAPATAATDHSVTISIGDLDLSAAQDRQVLDQRVASAARRVCKGGWRTAEARKLARECEAEVRASVAPQLRTAYASDRAKRLALVVNDPAA